MGTPVGSHKVPCGGIPLDLWANPLGPHCPLEAHKGIGIAAVERWLFSRGGSCRQFFRQFFYKGNRDKKKLVKKLVGGPRR